MARIATPTPLEIQLLVGIVLTVMGTALHWQLPRRRMSIEERIKDGKITAAQAERLLRFQRRLAPVLTVGGALLTLAAFVIYAG